MRRFLTAVCVVLALTVGVFGQGYSGPPTLQGFQATGLSLPYTVGTMTVGGYQQPILVGAVTVLDNQVSCISPQFASCNIVYWPGTGTVLLNTTLPATAFKNGTAVVGYVTTSGGVITGITSPSATTAIPGGVPVAGWFNALNIGGMRLPVCNNLLVQGCQVNSGSLSGY